MLKGIEVKAPEEKESEITKNIIAIAREEGVLVLKSGKNVLRIAPPLVISEGESKKGADIVYRTFSRFKEKLGKDF